MTREGGFRILLKKGGYTPRSGLFLAETINNLCGVEGKSVLDIGTGETGFLARFAGFKGAVRVVGSDLDAEAIQHASSVGGTDEINCNWVVSDVFDEIPPERFDFIVSNPPQMPSPCPGPLHDYGGLDGREIILKILSGADNYLAASGQIIFCCFDFLGINRRTNDQPSIQEISYKLGYGFRILQRKARVVRKGGETERNISWIKKIYPQYGFNHDNGNLIYELMTVKLKKGR